MKKKIGIDQHKKNQLPSGCFRGATIKVNSLAADIIIKDNIGIISSLFLVCACDIAIAPLEKKQPLYDCVRGQVNTTDQRTAVVTIIDTACLFSIELRKIGKIFSIGQISEKGQVCQIIHRGVISPFHPFSPPFSLFYVIIYHSITKKSEKGEIQTLKKMAQKVCNILHIYNIKKVIVNRIHPFHFRGLSACIITTCQGEIEGEKSEKGERPNRSFKHATL